jgi:MFS family permease
MTTLHASIEDIDSARALRRLLATLLVIALGNGVMYVVSVVLPVVQKEFGVTRADAALPYTLLMLGLGIGGIFMGKMADRHGAMRPLLIGGVATCLGYSVAAHAQSLWAFSLAHGMILGLLGSSVTFAPLMADTAQWWSRRRGIAVAVCASGNYLAGAFWPPVVQWAVAQWGWRDAYQMLGWVCGGGMLCLTLMFRMRPPRQPDAASSSSAAGATAWISEQPLGLPRVRALALLSVAGVACCVAMSMPQVHIVAYCTDLGFGPARGAEMLSLMLGCGIVSRLLSGHICDRIGGLRTLLLGSVLQGLALLLFLPFEGMASLYLASALFGLFQGGIVPSYAIIIREYFPASRAGSQTGTVIMATMLGMALGGWMSGAIFDATGSYKMAFLNGIAFNLLNLVIAVYFFRRARALKQLRA